MYRVYDHTCSQSLAPTKQDNAFPRASPAGRPTSTLLITTAFLLVLVCRSPAQHCTAQLTPCSDLLHTSKRMHHVPGVDSAFDLRSTWLGAWMRAYSQPRPIPPSASFLHHTLSHRTNQTNDSGVEDPCPAESAGEYRGWCEYCGGGLACFTSLDGRAKRPNAFTSVERPRQGRWNGRECRDGSDGRDPCPTESTGERGRCNAAVMVVDLHVALLCSCLWFPRHGHPHTHYGRLPHVARLHCSTLGSILPLAARARRCASRENGQMHGLVFAPKSAYIRCHVLKYTRGGTRNGRKCRDCTGVRNSKEDPCPAEVLHKAHSRLSALAAVHERGSAGGILYCRDTLLSGYSAFLLSGCSTFRLLYHQAAQPTKRPE